MSKCSPQHEKGAVHYLTAALVNQTQRVALNFGHPVHQHSCSGYSGPVCFKVCCSFPRPPSRSTATGAWSKCSPQHETSAVYYLAAALVNETHQAALHVFHEEHKHSCWGCGGWWCFEADCLFLRPPLDPQQPGLCFSAVCDMRKQLCTTWLLL